MDLFTTLNNGSLNLAHAVLTNDDTLLIGAAAFQEATGSTQDRLCVAISTMIAACKAPVQTMDLPAELEELTMRQLAAIANSHNMPYSGLRKAELITKLRRHARMRAEMA
jgi:hypothetical protein